MIPVPVFRQARALLLKVACLGLAVGVSMQLYFHLLAREDWIYTKFSYPASPSLVIGSSRGFQGIRPDIFNASDLGFERPMYNFCFTVIPTKFGPAYVRQLEAKVKPGTRNGLFILDVSPMALTSDTGAALGDTNAFAERTSYMNMRENPTSRLNYEYLLKYFIDPYYTLLSNKVLKEKVKMRVSEDGWLEVTPPPMDSASLARRIEARVRTNVVSLFSRERFSPRRLEYLKSAIAFLSQRGKVVVVRMPVAPEMRQAENVCFPAFDSLMVSLRSEMGFRYVNLGETELRNHTMDGNHLHRDWAATASRMLVDSLRGEDQRVTLLPD
ncbi:MAG: hypothetical protein ABIY63_04595 [Fibrobacteria bacterium]